MENNDIKKQELNKQIEDAILAMAKDPQNIANYHTLSKLYLELQDYDKVMSVLESLLTISPNDVEALIGMGTKMILGLLSFVSIRLMVWQPIWQSMRR